MEWWSGGVVECVCLCVWVSCFSPFFLSFLACVRACVRVPLRLLLFWWFCFFGGLGVCGFLGSGSSGGVAASLWSFLSRLEPLYRLYATQSYIGGYGHEIAGFGLGESFEGFTLRFRMGAGLPVAVVRDGCAATLPLAAPSIKLS